jgi:hypothetical protein
MSSAAASRTERYLTHGRERRHAPGIEIEPDISVAIRTAEQQMRRSRVCVSGAAKSPILVVHRVGLARA